MTDCVVDANVAVMWFVDQPLSRQADQALDLYDFYAPDLIFAEIANAFWKYFRAGEIPLKQINAAMAGLENVYFIAAAVDEGLAQRALMLATDIDHPVYDCLYLSLAEKLKCPFLTADQKLIRKAHSIETIEVLDLAELPLPA